MDRNQHNELLLDIIFHALKGSILEKEDKEANIIGEEKVDVGKFSYLLGQSIRHWIIPDGNWHISKAALEVWKIVSGENKMPHYRYKECFRSKKNLIVPRFKGSNRNFRELESLELDKTRTYAFNDIFVAEHTIPVADIMNALVELYKSKNWNDENELKKRIKEILEKMHITQMLKIEERRITKCNKRIYLVLQKEKYNSIYQYLLNTADKEIFKTLRKICYTRLNSTKKKIDISHRLKEFKFPKNIAIPYWARAIDLSKPYIIEIA